MKKKIKKIIKSILPKKVIRKIKKINENYYRQHNNYSKKDRYIYLLKYYFKYKIYTKESKLLNSIKIYINNSYVYGIDYYKKLDSTNSVFGNNSIDYSKVLNYSLNDFSNMTDNNEIKELINDLNEYIDRIILKLKKSNNTNKEELIGYFENIKNKKCGCFNEALQRILFYNQLLWQFGHNLNGFGRLDKILEQYYTNDIDNKIITKEQAKEYLKEFCLLVNRDYIFKSLSLIGDTGQLIIIGGKEIDGSYFYNDLTEIFIEVIEEIQKPDPKLLLRVSKKIPMNLLEKAIKCISTGVGSPLLSNDEQVIDNLIKFGYDKEDAYNYSASACWEPLIAGKSLDPNNICSINFLKPFNDLFNNENIDNYKYNDIEKKYFIYLEKYLDNVVNQINEIKFEKSNLVSMLVDDCLKNNKDISEGGAKYNNYGFTSVGMSNVVNSLLNIKKFVYEDKIISLDELNKERLYNFQNETILNTLKNNKLKYGKDEEEVIKLTNKITKKTSDILKTKKTRFNGQFKFGLSSPGYIALAFEANASFDGRKSYEPYSVHISAMDSSYIELIQFASKLDYSDNRFNGNVIDYFVAPSFIENNLEKFTKFIYKSIENGFFQMQMNIVSSDILIKAKENPKLYPNLIVRVWGFSAYFNELPEEYQDLLIERALKSEQR